MRREQLFVHLRICAFVWPMRQQNHWKTTNTQKTPSDGNRSTMIFCKFVYLCIHQQNHSLQLGLHKRRLAYNFSSYVGSTKLCIWIFVSRTEIRTFRYRAHHGIFLKRGITRWCPLRIPLRVHFLQTRDPKTCDSLVTPYSIDEAN